MIPVGYMAKRVCVRSDWIKAERVVDVYSVSACVSEDFGDYINDWKHVQTNQHCLLASFERAHQLLEAGTFKNTEPGPYRIVAVYTAQWP